MITIIEGQEVYGNSDYITCQGGEFAEDSFVLCKKKTDEADNTVMFHAITIVEPVTEENN
jgi:hypothetical protein